MTDDTNDSVSRRRFLQATGTAATAAALAGCSGGGGGGDGDDGGDGTSTGGGPEDTPSETDTETDTQTEPEQTQSDRTYQLINSTITTFDPVALTDEASLSVAHNIFDALTNYPNGNTFTENLLAESFEASDDATTLTFKLREDATFFTDEYNNVPDYGNVTAADVVYSLNRLAESSNSKRASFLLTDLGVTHDTDSEGSYVPGSLGVEATGEYEVTINLSSPFHATLEILAYDVFAAHPEGIVGDIEGYDGDMNYKTFAEQKPVGSGAFALDTWSKGDEAVITARPIDDYTVLEGPYVSGVRWRIIEDQNAAYTYATINQNADHPVVTQAKYDPEKVTIEGRDSMGRSYGTYGPLENGKTVPYYQVAEVVTYYIGFHQPSVPKPVRKAFAYVFNQDEVVNDVLKGPGKIGVHLTPPNIFPGGVQGYEDHAEDYPYKATESDIPTARQLMEDAGYGPNNKYELEFTQYAGSQFWSQVIGILRDKLDAAHITLNAKETQFSTMLSQGRNGNLDAYTLGWGMDYPAPDNFLQLLYPPRTDTSQQAPVSYTDWEGTQWAEQATQAWERFKDNPGTSEEAQQARNEAYLAIEEANWEDVIFLNVFHPITEAMRYPWVQKPRVGGAGSASQKKTRVRIEERDK